MTTEKAERLKRMQAELHALYGATAKLRAFIEVDEEFAKLQAKEQQDMREQFVLMDLYARVLQRRLLRGMELSP